jgi:uncharacterized protein (TIGR03663 family)
MKPRTNEEKEKRRKGEKEKELPTLDSQSSPDRDPRPKSENLFWLVGCFVVTAIAAFLRFFWLELKPLHHDEGVNGYFLITLFRDGVYKYDPANYHGPDLYYLALAATKMFGLSTVSIRGSVALFGVLTVVLAFFLRKYIGSVGSLAAALFIALSPGMVYISRYFIHEILFVFFSFGIVVGVLYFIERKRAGALAIAMMTLLLLVCFLPTALNLATLVGKGNATTAWLVRIGLFAVEAFLVFLIMRMLLAWNEGRAIYLLLATASAVLLFATKETAFITIGTMAIACVCVWLWRKIYKAAFGEPKENELEPVELTWTNFRRRLGNSSDVLLIVAACFFIFAYVGVLFFSSFFTYPEGVRKAFEAYAIWTKTGSKDHTQNGTLAYLKWLWRIESPILILSSIGSLIAFFKARHRFPMFAALWAYGLFLAYSIIPYKTPWLAISFTLPMCIIAGYAINELVASRDFLLKIAGGILAIVAAAILGYQTYDLNFQRYDDDTMPYVYAHTRRGFLDLIGEIERYAEKSGKGKQASIEIVSPDYWSMPWYLRDYPKAIFHGKLADANASEMVVASEAQKGELTERYGAHYKYVGTYPLRPGVELYLLVRRDLADAGAKEIYQIDD